MSRGPGSTCRLRAYQWPDADDPDAPEAGDFLRTKTGTCYRIDAIRRRPPGSKVAAVIHVTRLERDAVHYGEPGVYAWWWSSRA